MKNKKNRGVTTQTWIMFGIFLIISFYCLKIISNANKITNSIVIPTPIALPTIANKPTTVHKIIKK